MRSVLVAAALMMTTPALAADPPAPAAAAAVRATRRVTAAHYPTLEKMLRRFSRQAGEARTRG